MSKPIIDQKYMYKLPQCTFDKQLHNPVVDKLIHWCHVCGEYADQIFRLTLPPYTKKEKREDAWRCDYKLKQILICKKCAVEKCTEQVIEAVIISSLKDNNVFVTT